MIALLKVLLISSAMFKVSNNLNPTKIIESEEEEKALSTIVNYYYAKQSNVVNIISCANHSKIFLESFLLKVLPSISIQLESCENISVAPRSAIGRNFIVILIDTANTEEMLKHMTRDRFDYSGHYMIYYLESIIDMSCLEIIFKKLFDLFIYNVNILTRTVNDSTEIQLETFYPFTEEGCKETKPVVINKFKNEVWENLNFFPKKMKSFLKCPLKVASFIYAPAIIMEGDKKNFTLHGSDIELLKGIANELNFTIQYSFDPEPGAWGDLKENGSSSGAFYKIIHGEADLTIGMIGRLYHREKFISFSSTIVFNPVLLIIPQGAPFSPFRKLFQPFQDYVWICLLAVFLVAMVLVTILTIRPNNKFKNYIMGRKINMPAMNLIGIIVGGTQHLLPTRSAARILLMTFMIFCLVKRSLYTASLFQFLQTDSRQPVVSSIQELMDRDFKIYYYPSFEENLKGFKFFEM